MVTCTYHLNPPAAISIYGWRYQTGHYCAYANGLPWLFCLRAPLFTLQMKLLHPCVSFLGTNYKNALQQVLCKVWFIYYLSYSKSLKKPKRRSWKLPPRKIAPRSGLGFVLGLVLELGSGGEQFSSGAIFLEPWKVLVQKLCLLNLMKQKVLAKQTGSFKIKFDKNAMLKYICNSTFCLLLCRWSI